MKAAKRNVSIGNDNVKLVRVSSKKKNEMNRQINFIYYLNKEQTNPYADCCRSC